MVFREIKEKDAKRKTHFRPPHKREAQAWPDRARNLDIWDGPKPKAREPNGPKPKRFSARSSPTQPFYRRSSAILIFSVRIRDVCGPRPEPESPQSETLFGRPATARSQRPESHNFLEFTHFLAIFYKHLKKSVLLLAHLANSALYFFLTSPPPHVMPHPH